MTEKTINLSKDELNKMFEEVSKLSEHHLPDSPEDACDVCDREWDVEVTLKNGKKAKLCSACAKEYKRGELPELDERGSDAPKSEEGSGSPKIADWYNSKSTSSIEKEFAECISNEDATFEGFKDLLDKNASYEELMDYLGLPTFWEMRFSSQGDDMDTMVWSKLYLGLYENGLLEYEDFFKRMRENS